jgi:hypothetical protein
MLTLFILKSGSANADPDKAKRSFGIVVTATVQLNALEDVNNEEVLTPWYGIIYDDEQADEHLAESLKTFLMYSDADVLSLYKASTNKGNPTKAPRLFKKNVQVRSDCLMPENGYALKLDTILNGWLE